MACAFCPNFVAPSSWLVTIKEVKMSRKRTNGLLVAALLVAVAFSATACKKLSYSGLVANYHFAKANRLFTERDYRLAIAEYEAALKANPTLVQAYRFLGESYKAIYKPGQDSPENKEKEEKALAALNKALEIEPTNKEIIFSLGDMYDRLRNFDEAEKLYLRIIELEPGNMGNYYVVAEFYKRYASEMPDAAKKAEAMYLRRIEADPENPEAYAYAATYYQEVTGEPEVVLAIRKDGSMYVNQPSPATISSAPIALGRKEAFRVRTPRPMQYAPNSTRVLIGNRTIPKSLSTPMVSAKKLKSAVTSDPTKLTGLNR